MGKKFNQIHLKLWYIKMVEFFYLGYEWKNNEELFNKI